MLTGSAESATEAYRAACARHDSNRFALRSCRDQLQLLADLGFRAEVVEPAIATLNQVLQRLEPGREGSADTWKPDQVLLFSGHRMDEPGREPPRFPPAHEDDAARRKPRLQFRELPEALGPTPELNVNPFERCNLWELYSALACGITKLRFITLLDGSSGGDGPGGTAHLLRQVKRRTGRVEWIDTRTLKADGAAHEALSTSPGS